jgi:hypothetical protein
MIPSDVLHLGQNLSTSRLFGDAAPVNEALHDLEQNLGFVVSRPHCVQLFMGPYPFRLLNG